MLLIWELSSFGLKWILGRNGANALGKALPTAAATSVDRTNENRESRPFVCIT